MLYSASPWFVCINCPCVLLSLPCVSLVVENKFSIPRIYFRHLGSFTVTLSTRLNSHIKVIIKRVHMTETVFVASDQSQTRTGVLATERHILQMTFSNVFFVIVVHVNFLNFQKYHSIIPSLCTCGTFTLTCCLFNVLFLFLIHLKHNNFPCGINKVSTYDMKGTPVCNMSPLSN